MTSTNSQSHDSWADEYYDKSREMGWYGPQVLFGLMYSHIHSGESLLDLGIGTGLGPMKFHEAGLVISGIDSSPAMLEKCNEKHPPFTLIQHDLTNPPWPFDDKDFHHIMSTGVFHFFGELDNALREVARIIRPGGVFGFDFYEYDARNIEGYDEAAHGVYSKLDTEYDIRVFRHSEQYIFAQLSKAGFDLLDDLKFLVSKQDGMYFRSVTARRRTV